MKKILVTGVNGFVGGHLSRELRDRGCQVIGVGQQPGASPDVNHLLDSYFCADLTQPQEVNSLPLEDLDAVISLAGLADVGRSFKEPDRYQDVNTSVVANVSNTLIAKGKSGVRHLAVSSGAVYDSRQSPPFAEDSATDASSSPYVASKLAMEQLCAGHRSQGLDVVVVRPFNHIGPDQGGGFLLPDLVKEARRVLQDGSELRVGNLETRRDYTDVRDVVRAYGMLALADTVDFPLYNVCSGRSVSGKKILDLVINNLSPDKKLRVVVDPEKYRPSDAMDIYGSYARLRQQTGWQPSIKLEQTVSDFIFGEGGRSSGVDQIEPIPTPVG